MSRANGKAANTYGGKTIPGFTDTDDGLIPHLIIDTPYGQVHAPVRLVLGLRTHSRAPVPERDELGNLVYALPGGGKATFPRVMGVAA